MASKLIRLRDTPLTHEHLLRVLEYDSVAGVFYRRTGPQAWRPIATGDGAHGYPRMHVNGRRYYCHVLAWFYVHRVMPGAGEIDHRDNDRANYKIKNLRLITRKLNAQNQHKPGVRNKSGRLGVSWDKQRGLWVSRIRLPCGVYKYVGRFADRDRASDAYIEAKRKYHEGFTG